MRLGGAVAFDGGGLCRGAVLERGRFKHRRAGAVARLREYLPIAQRFNAILVVGLLQGLRADEPDAEVANERIAAGLREVGLAAQDVWRGFGRRADQSLTSGV